MPARIITLCLVASVLAAGAAIAAETVYGDGVSAPDTVLVSRVLDHPEAWAGKTVRVAGTAVAVCAERGCWVDIASDREGQTLRLKVKDGEIVFPLEVAGLPIVAEGVFKVNPPETSGKVCPREAARLAKTCDAEKAAACMTSYEIAGTGAVVTLAGE